MCNFICVPTVDRLTAGATGHHGPALSTLPTKAILVSTETAAPDP